MDVLVLIPSESGKHSDRVNAQQGAGDDVLIPSESGKHSDSENELFSSICGGLNPFGVREAFGPSISEEQEKEIES